MNTCLVVYYINYTIQYYMNSLFNLKVHLCLNVFYGIKLRYYSNLVNLRLLRIRLDIDGVDPGASQRRNDQPTSGSTRIVEAARTSVPSWKSWSDGFKHFCRVDRIVLNVMKVLIGWADRIFWNYLDEIVYQIVWWISHHITS